MKLTLGPIPFLWDKDSILSFYKEISATPVSVVYVGEVICSKRTTLSIETLKTIGRMLQDAGKEVVISTLGLITNQEELALIEDLFTLPYAIEANNIGVLNKCDGRDVIGGPHLAIYNAPTAEYLAGMGLKRIVFMPELNSNIIESISRSVPSVEKEVIGFGNLPLAFSWRCYTARALEMSKSNCAVICKNYPDGMPIETMDKMPLFNINGTQLMSAQKVCLIGQHDRLEEAGITYFRIIPQARNTSDIINIVLGIMKGTISYPKALEALMRYAPEGISNGWFFGQAGWEYVDQESVTAGSSQASRHSIPHHH